MIEFDPVKDASNLAKHGITLADAARFDFGRAIVEWDDRRAYGEKRQVATGFIDARLYVLVFTMRGSTMRVISLRKANKRELRIYEQQS